MKLRKDVMYKFVRLHVKFETMYTSEPVQWQNHQD